MLTFTTFLVESLDVDKLKHLEHADTILAAFRHT